MTTGRFTNLRDYIDALVAAHGSWRSCGKAIGVDGSYLFRLRNGEASNPSEEVLHKLGLRRVVIYEVIENREPVIDPD